MYNCKFDTPKIHQNIHQTYTKRGHGIFTDTCTQNGERRIDPEEPTPEELHRLPFWIQRGELYRIQSADPLPLPRSFRGYPVQLRNKQNKQMLFKGGNEM